MKRFSFVATSLAVLALAQGAFGQGKLKIGDAAPALAVSHWLKGTPIKGLAKDKTYVVEFWATWCGPCKVSIPHLTEMAKEFSGKVEFIGVSIWETQPGQSDPNLKEKVGKFVTEMGDKMDYNVVMDDAANSMAKNWMEAAGENGIPSAFVITGGKIAWIGHPMGGLKEVLSDVVAGKFDADKEAKRRAEAMKAQEEQEKAMSKLMPLLQEGKHKEAVAVIDEMIKNGSPMKAQLSSMKFNALIQSDEAAAYKFGRELADGEFKNNAMMLNMIAWTIVDDASDLKKPDLEAAVYIAEKGVKLEPNNAYILDTLAYALFKQGKIDQALEYQKRAVDAMAKMDDMPEETKKEIKDRYEMFKKKKAGG